VLSSVTTKLNLDALRANTAIIPQSVRSLFLLLVSVRFVTDERPSAQPELLSGTLRRNLDLFGEHGDAVLNDVLGMVGFSESAARSSEYALTLDSPISAGGANLSVGQRQLAASAQAIVRRSTLLILDEATSAIGISSSCPVREH
jgi:ABC-type multidrug transport system fused ATPase/permease subunit